MPRPFDAVMLEVGDGHWIYAEEIGARGGIPALFLHGGPGSGSQHGHRLLFDTARFHAVLFDQRGAGRSHPYLATHANTTQHLVADIERIRVHFGFEKMLIVGGSWGSTLAFAYAEEYPERVSGLVLRAVFLGTDAEVDWAFRQRPAAAAPGSLREFRRGPARERTRRPAQVLRCPIDRPLIRPCTDQPRGAGSNSSAYCLSFSLVRQRLRKEQRIQAASRRRRSSKRTTSPMASSLARISSLTARRGWGPFPA